MIIVFCIIFVFLTSCRSSDHLETKDYEMIHFNNPKCTGMSASGVLMVRKEDKHILESSISHKTGFCEAVTGQVIDAGGKAAGQYMLQQGLKKSGRVNTGSVINNSESNSAATTNGTQTEECEEPGQCGP